MCRKGRLVLFSGPSGVGKDTLLEILYKRIPELQHSVSVTTREMRPNEVEGRDYYFISLDEFERMRENGEILEFNKYGSHYYATPKKPIDNWLKDGKDVVLKIDVHGTANVKKLYKKKCVSIFILPPSIEELENRLRLRGTESESDFRIRMETAVNEIEQSESYDYRVVNDDLEKAADEVVKILKHKKLK
jgi:guanylate kinase